MSRYGMILAAAALVFTVGCDDFKPKKGRTGDVIGKYTQDIGEYKAEEKRTVSEGKAEYSDPILGPLEMYGPIVQDISSMAVNNQLAMFNVMNERFPNSYEEFMEEIIRKPGLKLPVLPGKKRYQYDVANHCIVVVEPLRDAEGKVMAEPTTAATTEVTPAAPTDPAAPAAPTAPAGQGEAGADPNRIQLPRGLSLPAPQTLPE